MQQGHTPHTRRRIIVGLAAAVTVLIALVLAYLAQTDAVRSQPVASAAGTATPTPADTSLQTCHALSVAKAAIQNAPEGTPNDPLVYRPVWEAARTAKDPGIKAAGARLESLAAEIEQLPTPGAVPGDLRSFNAGLELFKGATTLGTACVNVFGDGPW